MSLKGIRKMFKIPLSIVSEEEFHLVIRADNPS